MKATTSAAAVTLAITLMSAANISVAAVDTKQPNKASAPTLAAGIDSKYQDKKVRPQDDFYRHVNGKWLKIAKIPDDKSSAGAFIDLREATIPQLHAIIEDLGKSAPKAGSEVQKISDAYTTFMDTATINSLGLKALSRDFSIIANISFKEQIPGYIAYLNRVSLTAPFDISVHQDNKDSTKYVLDISQSGLGLPDRDYYLNETDDKLKDTRAKYQQHIEKILTLAGESDANKNAADIVALETKLAKAQWTKVELRDPIKAYNKFEASKLAELTPEFNWVSYFLPLGVNPNIDSVIVSQPSYLKAFAQIVQETPITVWKAYFRWHVISGTAQNLPKAFDDEHFAFYGKVLSGIPTQEARWKRGVRFINSSMGESLGKLYVEKHFPASSKAKMEKLVGNLLLAYKQSIDTLDWMSPETKKEAQAKLALFTPKIGYPKKWRDYSPIDIRLGDAVGNQLKISAFLSLVELNKLGKPIDRDEWGMTPQTVNAYYNPEMNEIVFPAAILQAPFFNPKADDAVNYGGIGAVIGHEISHGFDDQGSQYDGKGNLRDWWTKEDHEKFRLKTAALIKQYSAYSPLPGYTVNGELTLGENIADNSGLAIAYKAYQLSLGGKPAPIINGMTGDQRFFMGWAQVWRSKIRDAAAIVRLKTDPHSPGEFRANGALRNLNPFYQSFGVKEGDKLYLPANERVNMW